MKVSRYNYVNSSFDKRFTEQKNCAANFLQRGEACAVPFTLLIEGMQVSREQRDPAHLETSSSLQTSEAVNRGEEYLRGTFEFRRAFIHYISYYIHVVLL